MISSKKPSDSPRKSSGLAQLEDPRYPSANLIRARLTELGMTQVELARQVAELQIKRIEEATGRPVTEGQRADIIQKTTESNVYKWTDGKHDRPRGTKLRNARGAALHTTPSHSVITDMCLTLRVPPTYLDNDSNSQPSENNLELARETIARAQPLVHAPALSASVPILGVAMGHSGGAPVLSGNEVKRHAAPADAADVSGAYGIYVIDDSMDPVLPRGMMVIVDPHHPRNREDNVVVQFTKDKGITINIEVRQFISMNDRHLIVKKFNPEQIIKYPIAEVVSVDKIVWQKPR